MDYSALPGGLDVEVMFKSTGYWPTEPAKQVLAREQAAIGAASGAAEWDRATGWTPFLSPANAQAQTYDFYLEADKFARTGVLSLDNGLLRLDGVSINGTPVPASHIIGKPDNAVVKGACFTHLYFPLHRQQARHWSRMPLNLAVTARWGFCKAENGCPADAWQQILQAAGLIALTQVENLQSIASLSLDGFSKAFDVVGILTQKDTADRWRREFPAAVARYKRLVA